jgi:hypothetical protein
MIFSDFIKDVLRTAKELIQKCLTYSSHKEEQQMLSEALESIKLMEQLLNDVIKGEDNVQIDLSLEEAVKDFKYVWYFIYSKYGCDIKNSSIDIDEYFYDRYVYAVKELLYQKQNRYGILYKIVNSVYDKTINIFKRRI